jgi:hypothetical protein
MDSLTAYNKRMVIEERKVFALSSTPLTISIGVGTGALFFALSLWGGYEAIVNLLSDGEFPYSLLLLAGSLMFLWLAVASVLNAIGEKVFLGESEIIVRTAYGRTYSYKYEQLYGVDQSHLTDIDLVFADGHKLRLKERIILPVSNTESIIYFLEKKTGRTLI